MRDSSLVAFNVVATKLLHKVFDARLKLISTGFSDGELIKRSTSSLDGFR